MIETEKTPEVSPSAIEAPITLDELRKLVSDVDPAALLVDPWLMRRIIKSDRGIDGIFVDIPHRKTYCLAKAALLAVATRQELGIGEAHVLPDRLVLLSCSTSWLRGYSRRETLLQFWRLLFHAAIDRELSEGKELVLLAARQRLGAAELAEVTSVLQSENLLLPPVDDARSFAEFVAVYLELKHFAPALLDCTFPGLTDDPCQSLQVMGSLDAQAIFLRTRLAGAPDPTFVEQADRDQASIAQSIHEKQTANAGQFGVLLARADTVRHKGNLVRSAILWIQAVGCAAQDRKEAALQGARQDLDALVARLQGPLSLGEESAQLWRQALPALLGPASDNIWPHAARLLYDLQKICTDSEKETYAVDLVEWVCSLGRKAIVRPLPLRADVLRFKHLKKAHSRLPKIANLDLGKFGELNFDLGKLGELLQQALHGAEERLRARIRPLLEETFQEIGFVPVNVPETLARDKIVEELLDRICERGFINMGDVRDAIARNQLKIPDASPLQVLLGDQLLRSNRRLAERLDGVYRRGEIYLRWLQRLSSILFGNWLGRWLVLFIILPFGGAFATGIFMQEMLHLAGIRVHIRGTGRAVDQRVLGWWDFILQAISDVRHPGLWRELDEHGQASFRVNPVEAIAGVFILGVYFLLLLHLASVRRASWKCLTLIWSILRGIFYDGPLHFVTLPRVRVFLEWTPVRWFRRWILRSLLAGLAAQMLWLPFDRPGGWDNVEVGLGVFALGLIFFNTPLARRTEEAVTLWLSRNWNTLLFLAANIVGWVIDSFKVVLDRIERAIYAVDEWLRFRQGDSRFSLVWKLVLGLIWFVVTYVIRIVIHLFVEPTVNPVKHFPAVTVGAKMIIPFIQPVAEEMTALLGPFLGTPLSLAVAAAVVLLVPGIFGFAVWEFKENWKLYQANRSRNLRPVMIGHHGETMARLLRPGFHSGTVPKAYRKLRHAMQDGNSRKIHLERDNLHHVSAAVTHFVERELLTLLKLSKHGRGLSIEAGKVKLATNRIRIDLRCPLGEPMLLSFVLRSGVLEAVTEKPGWLGQLPEDQAAVFRQALTGWLQLAGAKVFDGVKVSDVSWAAWVEGWEKEQRS